MNLRKLIFLGNVMLITLKNKIMNKLYILISFRIILLFTTAIIMSFIPDYLPEIFDVKCDGTSPVTYYGSTYYQCSETWGDCSSRLQHPAQYHWGYRHFLFCFMGICLFILQVVEIINKLNKDSNETNI